MKLFGSITRIVFLCSFYLASVCLLSLSWAEDVDVHGAQASGELLQTDNVTVANFSADRSNSFQSVASGSDVTNSVVVQSSFEENPARHFSQPEFAFVDAASQNSGIFNEITDSGQGAAFTLADGATAELQHRADIPSAINETPNLAVSNSTGEQRNVTLVDLTPLESEVENRSEAADNTEQTETVVIRIDVPIVEPKENLTDKSDKGEDAPSDKSEDIPSFSEWAQKQLEEAEKKKEPVNSSSQTVTVNGKLNNVKVRSKNYASLDCGAKIVAANPEAGSANSVLSSSRDEYMLNACTNKIWFIVELCEAIQAKKIDLANFELFSSSPKDVGVFISDRYPSREWLNVGQFAARDERDVQNFDLNPHLFGKFMKVEMHSHHGSEHFCPISLFRVYGTSEFEVLEKEDQAHGNVADDDDDDDEALDADNGEPPRNLFSSATDAVISIVKKAAEVLGNKANNSNQTAEHSTKSARLISTCSTPTHLIVCDNCSDVLFAEVYDLLSCRSKEIYGLAKLELIKKSLYELDACQQFGLDFRTKRVSVRTGIDSAYARSFFSPTYLDALCNAIAVTENKVVLNVSQQFPNVTTGAPCDDPQTVDPTNHVERPKADEVRPTEKLSFDKIELATSIPGNATNISDASEINPTKTYTPENDLNTHTSAENKDDIKTVDPAETLGTQTQQENATQESSGADLDASGENLELEVTTESTELELDLISELNGPNTAPSAVLQAKESVLQAKESVFLRLSNRIKALERNMSLSSQYLEELSRRYKKQVEEMQRLLDKTLNALSVESKKRDEHNRRLEQQLSELSAIVNTLVVEKNNWITTTYWLFLTMIAIFGILTFCRRAEHKRAEGDVAGAAVQRRKSIAVVNHNEPAKKERRPSEEALKIAGTYKDLMIDEVDAKKRIKERKKRKKKPPRRTNSISMLAEEEAESDPNPRTAASDLALPSKPVLMWNRQESAPATVAADWNAKNRIEEIPFALEESENSPLQSLPIPRPLLAIPVDKVNGNFVAKDFVKPLLPSFMKTASDSRSKRNGAAVKVNGDGVHKKSASVDETPRQPSPAPSVGATSLNVVFDEIKPTTPKKEKRGGIRRIFRKVF